uniref:Uncharacterized protein n=1 Tax=Cannabis sativa TaxID=3483 RepID=A0A803QF91_CANSA
MSQSGSEIYPPEFVGPEYPRHIDSPYKPKNFEPQSRLEIKDARIRDHLIKSNQEETASRYRRFLQEISKGKRRWECPNPLKIACFYSVKVVPTRKNIAGGFYYHRAYTGDHKLIVRLPNKTDFKEDLFWATVPRRPIPTPEIAEHHKTLLSLPFGLRALDFLLNEQNLKNVPIPEEEKSDDFVAHAYYLERVPPRVDGRSRDMDVDLENMFKSPPQADKRSKKRVAQADEASNSIKELKRTKTKANKIKSLNQLTTEAAKSIEARNEFSGSRLDVILLEPSYPLPLEVGTEGSYLSSQHTTNSWRNLLTLGSSDWDLAIQRSAEFSLSSHAWFLVHATHHRSSQQVKMLETKLRKVREHKDVVAKKWSDSEAEVSRPKEEARK